MKKMFLEAIKIMVNLRSATKEWNQYYGCELLNKKKRWETKADNFLEEFKNKKA